jgi:hypothetical protein
MKRLSIALLGIMLFMCLNQANAKTTPKPSTATATARTRTVTGTVSADEKRLVADKDEKNWTVANPKTLKGHAGDYVSVTAQVDSKNEVTVKSVKLLEAHAANTHNTVKDNDDKLRVPLPPRGQQTF